MTLSRGRLRRAEPRAPHRRALPGLVTSAARVALREYGNKRTRSDRRSPPVALYRGGDMKGRAGSCSSARGAAHW